MATVLRTRLEPLQLDLDRLDTEPEAIQDYCRAVQERIRYGLPPLAEVLRLGEPARAVALRERDAALGLATLRSGTLLLLARLFREAGLHMADHLFGPHEATLRASEKQAILPPHAHVQKKISLQLEEDLVLVTGVGDHVLTRAQRSALVAALGLPHRALRHAAINPPALCAERQFGLLRGMVSPFIPLGFGTALRAVAHLSWPTEWEEQESHSSAISLSPCESLLVPLRCYRQILTGHLHWCLSGTPFIELGRAET